MALPSKPNPSSHLKYAHLALQLLLAIAVAGWLGYKLDQYLGFSVPVFMIVFGFVAFAGMLYQVYRSLHQD
jgi:F0F1-type ATP synthase assembly protein I